VADCLVPKLLVNNKILSDLLSVFGSLSWSRAHVEDHVNQKSNLISVQTEMPTANMFS